MSLIKDLEFELARAEKLYGPNGPVTQRRRDELNAVRENNGKSAKQIFLTGGRSKAVPKSNQKPK